MSGALIKRWRALAGEGADATGLQVIDAWNEPHRHYHNQGHLVWLLDEMERRVDLICDSAFVGYAIWFHDAIYRPGQSDNETKSAAWAREAIADEDLGRRVTHVIEMTKRHHEGEAHGDEAIFLDMDIAVLGAPRPRYYAYAAGVRREFSMYPDAAFAIGRRQFLEQALSLERLFRTEFYECEMGAVARANMAWELEEMRLGRMVGA